MVFLPIRPLGCGLRLGIPNLGLWKNGAGLAWGLKAGRLPSTERTYLLHMLPATRLVEAQRAELPNLRGLCSPDCRALPDLGTGARLDKQGWGGDEDDE